MTLKEIFLKKVKEKGGFVNCHAHLDKAYIINEKNLRFSQESMEKKWALYQEIKKNYTHRDLVRRISLGVEAMITQGVRFGRTLVDVDSTVKLLPLKAALAVKEKYKKKFFLQVGTQTLQGVVNSKERKWLEEGAKLADIIGCLPSRDRPQEEKHLDIVFKLAKKLDKDVDVHIDQENNPDEHDSLMLASKVLEHKMIGRVNAIHCISLSAQSEKEFEEVVGMFKRGQVNIIVCPSAALSMKSLRQKNSSIHNSIARVPQMLAAGLNVSLGTDNIYDLFQPFVDGDMWVETRILMEACRFYDLEQVANIVTINGRKTLKIAY